MQQVTATHPTSESRRRPLTETERAKILARIIDIITDDPGQALPSSETTGISFSRLNMHSEVASATPPSGMV